MNFKIVIINKDESQKSKIISAEWSGDAIAEAHEIAESNPLVSAILVLSEDGHTCEGITGAAYSVGM